jgi:hypothetical protein
METIVDKTLQKVIDYKLNKYYTDDIKSAVYSDGDEIDLNILNKELKISGQQFLFIKNNLKDITKALHNSKEFSKLFNDVKNELTYHIVSELQIQLKDELENVQIEMQETDEEMREKEKDNKRQLLIKKAKEKLKKANLTQEELKAIGLN